MTRGVAGHCFDIDGQWWNGHGPGSGCPNCDVERTLDIEFESQRVAPCAACGRVERVTQGDRGPVKGRRVTCDLGRFSFCLDCLAGSSVETEAEGEYSLSWLRVAAPPSAGHRWLVEVS